jgi:hypothetical protein
MAQDIKSWASKFKSLSDSDPAIASMGKYFTCTYLWDMTDKKVIIEMHDGKVKHINTDPQPLDPYDFALRASAASWREFGQPVPRPMFHGIWAASFREDLKIEGNHLIMISSGKSRATRSPWGVPPRPGPSAPQPDPLPVIA